jgi:hypothetical protein
VLKELQDQLVLQAFKVSLAHKEFQVLKVQREFRVFQDFKVLLDLQVLLVFKV